MWTSYLGDRYQAHFLFSTNHQKVTENGGITNDDYIKHPELFTESFATNEIPTVLQQNWNRNDNQHIFFTHRYNVGFSRKVKMTEEEIKAALARMDEARANLPEIVATQNAMLRLKAEHPDRTDLKPSAEDIQREVEEFFRTYPDYRRE